ncbi:MAG: hypothetical protein ABIH83_02695 [Candidatus Micrarchaeota archaeon]
MNDNMGTYTASQKPVRITCQQENGREKRIMTVPRNYISEFRNRKLAEESIYPENEKRHYTNHTKNPKLALLEASVSYLKEVEEKLKKNLKLSQNDFRKKNETLNTAGEELAEAQKKLRRTFNNICNCVDTRKGGERKIKKATELISSNFEKSITQHSLDSVDLKASMGNFNMCKEMGFEPNSQRVRELCANKPWAKGEKDEIAADPRQIMEEYYKLFNSNTAEWKDILEPALENIKKLPDSMQMSIKNEHIDVEWLTQKPKDVQDALRLVSAISEKSVGRIIEIQNEICSKYLAVSIEPLENIKNMQEGAISSLTKLLKDYKEYTKYVFSAKERWLKILKSPLKDIKNRLTKGKQELKDIIDALTQNLEAQEKIIEQIRYIATIYSDMFFSMKKEIALSSELAKLQKEVRNSEDRVKIRKEETEKAKGKAERNEIKIRAVVSVRETVECELNKVLENIHKRENKLWEHIRDSPKKDMRELRRKEKKSYIPYIPQTEEMTDEEKIKMYKEVIGKSIDKLVEHIWDHEAYSGFCKIENLKYKERFAYRIKILASIYIKNGGKLTFKSIVAKMGKVRCKLESPLCNASDDFSMVRIAFAETIRYRFIIGVNDARNPIIYFIGKKDGSDYFLNNTLYINERKGAQHDGRMNMFQEVLGEAVKAQKELKKIK